MRLLLTSIAMSAILFIASTAVLASDRQSRCDTSFGEGGAAIHKPCREGGA